MVTTFETDLPGVLIIRSTVYKDSRGYFREAYNEDTYFAKGVKEPLLQANHSFSQKDVLRGLHYQLVKPQAKLCRVIAGEILDVIADIRVGSPTFGQHIIQKLDPLGVDAVYIPAGYIHGFLALTDVHFEYFCSQTYSGPTDQLGVRWNDPDLAIPWPITDPILSEQDRNLPYLKDISATCRPR